MECGPRAGLLGSQLGHRARDGKQEPGLLRGSCPALALVVVRAGGQASVQCRSGTEAGEELGVSSWDSFCSLVPTV